MRRNLWAVLFAAALIAGLWGAVGGWWLGLPLGGEVRDDLLVDETRWSLHNILATIPDPAFGNVPVVPRYEEGYVARSKFLPALQWQAFGAAPPNAAVAQSVQSAQKGPSPPPEPAYRAYESNLPYSRAVATLRPPADVNYCVSVLYPASSPGSPTDCLRFPSDMLPQGRAATISGNALRVSPKALAPPINVDVPRSAAADGPRAIALNSVGLSENVTAVFSLTVGSYGPTANAGTATAPAAAGAERSVLWAGGLLGRIYRLRQTDSDHYSIALLQVPTSVSIELILFASADRGWAFTPYPDDADRRSSASASIFQTSDGGATWRRLQARWLPAPWVFVAFVVAFAAFDRFTRAQSDIRPRAERGYVADYGVSDDPIRLDDADALGLRPIAKSMSRFLRNLETKPTVTIGVTGPWGSGKTSLMNLVRDDLAEAGVQTVWFNAWHNQKEENLLAALLAAIRVQAVPSAWTLPGLDYRLRVAWRRAIDDPARSLGFLLLTAVAVWLFVEYADAAASKLSQLANAFASLFGSGTGTGTGTAGAGMSGAGAGDALKTIGLSTGSLGGLLFASKKLWDLFSPLKAVPAELLASFGGRRDTKDLNQQLSFRYRFAGEFATFCDTLRRPPHPGLVIFVDDLDRCGPGQTVDVLEAINFVASAGRCFVVLGLDDSKVKAAIADVYKTITLKLDDVAPAAGAVPLTEDQREWKRKQDLARFASNYLEKLIHLIVPVPRSRKSTVEALLGLSPPLGLPRGRDTAAAAKRLAAEFLGTFVVVAFLVTAGWLAVDLTTRLLPAAVSEPAAGAATTPRAPSASGVPAASGGVSPPAAAATPAMSPDQLARLGVLSADTFGSIPPSAAVLMFLLVLTVFGAQLVPRLYPEPIIDDSPEFVRALRIWCDGVAASRDTPRAVKRFINRVRFMAMQLREVTAAFERKSETAQLDEPTLVTFAVIEDLDEDCLGTSKLKALAENTSGAEDAAGMMISRGLRDYEGAFGRKIYTDGTALAVYRTIAGLVVERGGK